MPKRLRGLLEFTEAETYKSGVDGRQAAFRNRISKHEICDIPLIFVKARSVIAIEEKLRVQQRDRVMLIVICRLYDSHTDANRVMLALEAAGLPQSATGMISNNSDSWYSGTKADNVIPIRQDTADGKVEGAAVGAAIGATAATAASLITMLAIPGVGAIVGAGWLAAILGSMAIGGVAGGLLGALTNAGISEEDAQVFVEGVRRGGSLVAARVPRRASRRS
jgi:hypothetical protein